MIERVYQVLLTTSCFEPGHLAGGPVRSVARIIDTAADDVDIVAVTRDRDLGGREPYPGLSGRWVERGRSEIFYLDTSRPVQWRGLLRRLRRQQFDLLYCNSLWDPVFSVLAVLAVYLGVVRVRRILIAPRGELSPGALRLKARKKTLFLKVWRPLLTADRVVWHASTELEAADIRAVWPTARIEVIPDQVDLPLEPLAPQPDYRGPLRAVFISRISPMKNLLLALEALTLCGGNRVDFSIYGPIEDEAYWSRCLETIERLPAGIAATYHGSLDADKVRPTFAEHDLFILPTAGENFGHVIAESLSASCPVLSSDRTPWSRVLGQGGGSVVTELSADPLAAEIARYADQSPETRHAGRIAAGAAYFTWRRQVTDENILDRLRRSQRIGL